MYLGQTNVDVCQVAAILAHMVLCGSAPGPFFQFANSRYLTQGQLIAAV